MPEILSVFACSAREVRQNKINLRRSLLRKRRWHRADLLLSLLNLQLEILKTSRWTRCMTQSRAVSVWWRCPLWNSIKMMINEIIIPTCTNNPLIAPALLKINSQHIHRIVFTHQQPRPAVLITWRESWDRWWQIQHRTWEKSKQGQMPIRRGWEPLLWVNLSLTGFQTRGANTSKKCWQGSLFRKWRVWWGPGRMKDMCLVVIVSIYDCIVLIPSSGLQCIIFTCQYSARPDMSSHGKQTGPGQDTLHLPPSTLQEMDNHHQELGWFYFNTPQCWWKITLWIFVTFMIYFLEVSTTPICLE